jgi:hypothetical protein
MLRSTVTCMNFDCAYIQYRPFPSYRPKALESRHTQLRLSIFFEITKRGRGPRDKELRANNSWTY